MSDKGETTKRILGKRVAPTEPKVLVVGCTGSDAQKIA
jgi:hypothetical protein